MRKIYLSVVGVFLLLFSGFAQTTPKDSANYKSKKLTFEEANFVSSYYRQDGNNSAVTGGIGSEKLTDIAGSVDVKLIRYDKYQRKHNYNFELGVDHYTSASSDKVDPRTLSSASHADTRVYPSFNWSVENEKKGSTFGAGVSFSNEFDYLSYGANVSFAQKTNNRNGEFTAKAQAYLDKVSLILPVELQPGYPRIRGEEGERSKGDFASSPRNSFSGSLSYSQVVNQRLQIMFLVDLIYQKGYLGLPFHRVYFTDNSLKVEHLPDKRFKIPLGFRANYFIGDKMIVKSFYRYYKDDWGLTAHTIDFETPFKITPFFSITPFYRYYKQTGIKYFQPYKMHNVSEEFYSSNYDLSAFNSNFFGAGFRIAPPKGVFGHKHINMLELRYGHYSKSNSMHSDVVSLNLKFK